MANLKGSGKGGRKRIHGDGDEKERMKRSYSLLMVGKKKINFFIPEEVYQQLVRLEEESGNKFHSDFLKELLDSYERMNKVIEIVNVKGEK
jgi:predicted CopG family antitoxin